jgi:hypothetical protein
MTSLDFVLNQYAVLADPPDPPQKLHKMVYRVDIGNDRVMSELTPVHSGEWTTTSTTFYGKCHNCNYSAHSQKQCPLSKCTHCGSFGHTASICSE